MANQDEDERVDKKLTKFCTGCIFNKFCNVQNAVKDIVKIDKFRCSFWEKG